VRELEGRRHRRRWQRRGCERGRRRWAERLDPNNNGGLQPYFHHEHPDNVQNGRRRLAPYKDLIVSVWPTADQGASQPGLYISFLKCLWVNGVVGTSDASSLTDATQHWPKNIFAAALVTDVTTGSTVNIASNDGTTLTFDGPMTTSPGDFYEISLPDIGIGQEVSMGNGTATPYGPTKLVSGQWNTFAVPLSAFDGGNTPYPKIEDDQILKFHLVLSSSTTEVHYFSNMGLR
jgi:hypothetical protein